MASCGLATACRSGRLSQEPTQIISLKQCAWRGSLAGLARLPAQQPRAISSRPAASLGSSKKYNKYKTRQDLERDYYREWERITKTTEEDRKRPMTPLTLLAFLPSFFKFYVIPGPLRFLWYVLVWVNLQQLGYQLRKRAVIAGLKLDRSRLRSRGSEAGYRLRETALRRLHGKESVFRPLQLWVRRQA